MTVIKILIELSSLAIKIILQYYLSAERVNYLFSFFALNVGDREHSVRLHR